MSQVSSHVNIKVLQKKVKATTEIIANYKTVCLIISYFSFRLELDQWEKKSESILCYEMLIYNII